MKSITIKRVINMKSASWFHLISYDLEKEVVDTQIIDNLANFSIESLERESSEEICY